MKSATVYVHGKGGSAAEAEHYIPLFPGSDVLGFDYKAQTPWEAKSEFPPYFAKLREKYEKITVVANSIGAYFAVHSLSGGSINAAYLVSPVADMEALITGMMAAEGVSEDELRRRKTVPTSFGEPLSWEYLSYARANPPYWEVPTKILYGENDALVPRGAVEAFAKRINAELTVMPGGEHWFHTKDQLRFLDAWITRR